MTLEIIMDAINIKAVTIEKISTFAGSPKRYKTIKKETYTNADPVSFCKMINRIGVKINPVTISRVFKLLILMLRVLKNLARTKQVAHLANSAGCTLRKPKSNHDLAPFTSAPKRRTPNKDNIVMK